MICERKRRLAYGEGRKEEEGQGGGKASIVHIYLGANLLLALAEQAEATRSTSVVPILAEIVHYRPSATLASCPTKCAVSNSEA